MKKILLSTMLAGCVFAAAAQGSAWEQPQKQREKKEGPGRNYINLAYAKQNLGEEGDAISSKLGGALEFGTTFFFNRNRPIANMVRIGLDWSYIDLQGALFDLDGVDSEGKPIQAYFANAGMQIGPSVTVTPIRNLHAKAYVRYAPSVAAYAYKNEENEFDGGMWGYAGYVTGGVTVSWKFISAGVELRGGSSNMKSIKADDDSDMGFSTDKTKLSLPSTRLILGFRF